MKHTPLIEDIKKMIQTEESKEAALDQRRDSKVIYGQSDFRARAQSKHSLQE